METVIVVIAIIIIIVNVVYIFQFPITALREIRILQLLKHENVVNLIEICRTKGLCVLYPLN
jgi:serine/threonine protein kinase